MAGLTQEEMDKIKEVAETKHQQLFIDKLRALEAETGYRVIARLEYSQFGVYPTLAVQKTPEETKEEEAK